jgi:hypothetical protein
MFLDGFVAGPGETGFGRLFRWYDLVPVLLGGASRSSVA